DPGSVHPALCHLDRRWPLLSRWMAPFPVDAPGARYLAGGPASAPNGRLARPGHRATAAVDPPLPGNDACADLLGLPRHHAQHDRAIRSRIVGGFPPAP